MILKTVFNQLRLGDTLNAHGPGGETCLTRAVTMGLADAAEEFIRLGADPNRANAAGELPLFIAFAQRDRLMLVTLLQCGADIFAKKDGLTLREHAVKEGLADVAAYAADAEEQRLSFVSAMVCARPGM
jgi:ankyrin repeat protein